MTSCGNPGSLADGGGCGRARVEGEQCQLLSGCGGWKLCRCGLPDAVLCSGMPAGLLIPLWVCLPPCHRDPARLAPPLRLKERLNEESVERCAAGTRGVGGCARGTPAAAAATCASAANRRRRMKCWLLISMCMDLLDGEVKCLYCKDVGNGSNSVPHSALWAAAAAAVVGGGRGGRAGGGPGSDCWGTQIVDRVHHPHACMFSANLFLVCGGVHPKLMALLVADAFTTLPLQAQTPDGADVQIAAAPAASTRRGHLRLRRRRRRRVAAPHLLILSASSFS